MAGNTPTIGTETQGAIGMQVTPNVPKSTALRDTIASIAIASSLIFSNGASAATSPEIASISEEYKACIATAAETSKKFRTALEKKQSEGVDTKDLETRMKKIVDNANEGCVKIASADAKIASNLEKIKSTEAQIKSTEAQIKSADAKSAELAKIKKVEEEISKELKELDQAVEDYSKQKITTEEFQSKTAQVPQLAQKIRAQVAYVKQVMQDPKLLAIYDGYEPSLQKILQYVATVNSGETAKK